MSWIVFVVGEIKSYGDEWWDFTDTIVGFLYLAIHPACTPQVLYPEAIVNIEVHYYFIFFQPLHLYRL